MVEKDEKLFRPDKISEVNKVSYGSPDIVQLYRNYSFLKPPEKAILELLRKRSSKMRMLDIGVGGGRTTHFFAPLTYDYVGVDYSPEMIENCKKKFPNHTFKVVDVRKLSIFSDDYFDFTLFSNNGLDYMNHDDRMRALNEMHRVTKKAFICFSTHNLNNILSHFKFNLPSSRSTLRCFTDRLKSEAYRIYRLCFENRSSIFQLKKKPYLIFNDGAHGFRFLTYYVKPEEQIRQLKLLNYTNFETFGEDGRNISLSELPAVKDFYIYFLSSC